MGSEEVRGLGQGSCRQQGVEFNLAAQRVEGTVRSDMEATGRKGTGPP